MTQGLKARIQEDVKIAMKAGEKARLATIRLIMAAIKQREVDERIEMDDAQILAVLDKMVKQRRESIAQFEAAARTDLIEQEQSELAIIQAYLPTPFSDAEIDAAIAQALTETQASGIKDMGKVMGLLKTRLQGRADMAKVGEKIKAALAAG